MQTFCFVHKCFAGRCAEAFDAEKGGLEIAPAESELRPLLTAYMADFSTRANATLRHDGAT